MDFLRPNVEGESGAPESVPAPSEGLPAADVAAEPEKRPLGNWAARYDRRSEAPSLWSRLKRAFGRREEDAQPVRSAEAELDDALPGEVDISPPPGAAVSDVSLGEQIVLETQSDVQPDHAEVSQDLDAMLRAADAALSSSDLGENLDSLDGQGDDPGDPPKSEHPLGDQASQYDRRSENPHLWSTLARAFGRRAEDEDPAESADATEVSDVLPEGSDFERSFDSFAAPAAEDAPLPAVEFEESVEAPSDEVAIQPDFEAGGTAEERVGFFARMFGRKPDAERSDEFSSGEGARSARGADDNDPLAPERPLVEEPFETIDSDAFDAGQQEDPTLESQAEVLGQDLDTTFDPVPSEVPPSFDKTLDPYSPANPPDFDKTLDPDSPADPPDFDKTLDPDSPAVPPDFDKTLDPVIQAVPADFDKTLDPDAPGGVPDFDKTLDPVDAPPVDPPWWELPDPDAAGHDASGRPTDEVAVVDDGNSRDTDAVPVVEDDSRPTDEVPVVEDTEEVALPRRSLMARLMGWRKPRAGTAMTTSAEATRGQASFIVSKFRAFYGEILRYKHQQTEFAGAFQTMIADAASATEDPDSAAQQLSFRLQQVLELQLAEATWTGGESAARFPNAQYAMAALADETFRTLDWPGRVAWDKYSLELKLFQTRSAPSEFFRRVNRLLREEHRSPEARDLARVYLMVLASGFRGIYTDRRLDRLLAEYRRRLFEFVHDDDALLLYASDRVISPSAVERTIIGKGVSRFSSAQRWAAVLLFLIGGYVMLAHTVWTRLSADLRDVTERIESVSSSAGTTANGGER